MEEAASRRKARTKKQHDRSVGDFSEKSGMGES
jgi:hypothetical protein